MYHPRYERAAKASRQPTYHLQNTSRHLQGSKWSCTKLHWGYAIIVPPIKLVNYGQRSFSYAAPKLWNELPDSVRHSESISTFKQN
jgi:hypothetical protein